MALRLSLACENTDRTRALIDGRVTIEGCQTCYVGSEPEDIYRTLMTGLAGTPMPSYVDALEPDQAWDLVYYVLSLSNGKERAAR